MSRRELLGELLFQPWKKAVVFIVTVIGLFDLAISQGVVTVDQGKYQNLADILDRLSLPWWAWMIIWLASIIVLMFVGAYQMINRYNERPELLMLIQLRKQGITLWHEGKTKLSEETVEDWWEEHLAWREDCAQTIERVNASLAGEMRTLGTGNGIAWHQGISKGHNKKIWMQSAWNIRLDEIINKLREERYHQDR